MRESTFYQHYRCYGHEKADLCARGGVTLAVVKNGGAWHVGAAACSEKDHYCKATGRSTALTRVVENRDWGVSLFGPYIDQPRSELLNKIAELVWASAKRSPNVYLWQLPRRERKRKPKKKGLLTRVKESLVGT